MTRWLRKLRDWWRGRELSAVVFDHWYPPNNTIQCWEAGPERCFYCLAHIDTEAADRPCPRRRPDTTELA